MACIDANVERVIARVFDVDSPVKSGPAAARIAELVSDATPQPPEPPVLTAATACRWLERGELENLAMPAAHRKLADSLTAPKGPLLKGF